MISFLLLAVSAALMLLLLVQGPSGTGVLLAHGIAGVQRTAAFFEKGTWALAGTFMMLCLIA